MSERGPNDSIHWEALTWREKFRMALAFLAYHAVELSGEGWLSSILWKRLGGWYGLWAYDWRWANGTPMTPDEIAQIRKYQDERA